MRPTEELKHEHDAILLMLEIMDRAASRLDAGLAVPVGDLDAMIDFLKTFADGCHHAKEEGYLFPAMEQAGVPREHGPIGVMLAEHTLGRTYIARMSEAVQAIRTGMSAQASGFSESARGYRNLLQAHIQKENTILFPLADMRLSPAAEESIVKGFETIETEKVGAGKHEAYHALLRQFREKYLAAAPSTASQAGLV
jgi:hemerythrin-like domain-containing protein